MSANASIVCEYWQQQIDAGNRCHIQWMAPKIYLMKQIS